MLNIEKIEQIRESDLRDWRTINLVAINDIPIESHYHKHQIFEVDHEDTLPALSSAWKMVRASHFHPIKLRLEFEENQLRMDKELRETKIEVRRTDGCLERAKWYIEED